MVVQVPIHEVNEGLRLRQLFCEIRVGFIAVWILVHPDSQIDFILVCQHLVELLLIPKVIEILRILYFSLDASKGRNQELLENAEEHVSYLLDGSVSIILDVGVDLVVVVPHPVAQPV